ncbi:MAG: cell division protein FtsL [Candidatus Marithrix sp.]
MTKVIISLLTVLVFISAIQLILVRHKNRLLFVELQTLQHQQDKLNIELGQLQLEQGTLTNPDRIETIAKKRLNMIIPVTEDIIFLKN